MMVLVELSIRVSPLDMDSRPPVKPPDMPSNDGADMPPPDHAEMEPIEVGAVVSPRQFLVQVVDTKRFKLDLPVPPEVAGQRQPGREIVVRVDAFPDQTFQGRISSARTLPEGGAPKRLGIITVTIDDPSGRLKVGMSARVEFEL